MKCCFLSLIRVMKTHLTDIKIHSKGCKQQHGSGARTVCLLSLQSSIAVSHAVSINIKPKNLI